MQIAGLFRVHFDLAPQARNLHVHRTLLCLTPIPAQIFDQLRAADRLAWFHQRGLYVDWTQVHIAELPGSGMGALVVNGAGDYLELGIEYRPLPNEAISKWYRQRISGGKARHIFDKAEAIFEN